MPAEPSPPEQPPKMNDTYAVVNKVRGRGAAPARPPPALESSAFQASCSLPGSPVRRSSPAPEYAQLSPLPAAGNRPRHLGRRVRDPEVSYLGPKHLGQGGGVPRCLWQGMGWDGMDPGTQCQGQRLGNLSV